jgi:peptidoglycan hydrolase-like protein with peptidoglycan-binding domain
MARAMKEEIGNLRSLPRVKKQEREIRWLQASLNQILDLHLVVDGTFGDKTRAAVVRFQTEQQLQVDGIPGPITRARIQEILQES